MCGAFEVVAAMEPLLLLATMRPLEEEEGRCFGPPGVPPGGAYEISLLIHTIEPSGRVLVEIKLGVVLENARPASPLPSGPLKGVQMMLFNGTPTESTR